MDFNVCTRAMELRSKALGRYTPIGETQHNFLWHIPKKYFASVARNYILLISDIATNRGATLNGTFADTRKFSRATIYGAEVRETPAVWSSAKKEL